ncbi:MAG: S8 family peptidase [Pseudomonadota bacterium]
MKRATFDEVFFGEIDEVFFGRDRQLRFAVECPVKYEVWLAYAQGETDRLDLIFESSEDTEPKEVAAKFVELLTQAEFNVADAKIAVTGDFVATEIDFKELVACVLPLTSMREIVHIAADMSIDALRSLIQGERIPDQDYLPESTPRQRRREVADRLVWFVRLLAAVSDKAANTGRDQVQVDTVAEHLINILHRVQRPMTTTSQTVWQQKSYNAEPPPIEADEPMRLIERVTKNREASVAVTRSRTTIKADAVQRLFESSCKNIAWAIVDSGIDATHPAFQEPPGPPALPEASQSRIRATYDFTRVREALSLVTGGELDGRVSSGGEVNWSKIIEEGIRVEHNASYRKPKSDHGTHVAGILGAKWPERDLQGICPDIGLYDFRVLGDNGRGDEFSIVAALQFIRWINERARRTVIAGVNLSFSIPHDVANYSCGWTPVCAEADRLVRSGVVVVAAAGNSGYMGAAHATGTEYHNISVTDPGNTDRVITVGSTHRTDPHRHGVSFFSGRGPTADGRLKPDLVAPGEAIDGPIPGEEIRTMDGTSQAAPHVSGAAALLMARYRELIGAPERVKELLVSSATDLARDPTFQGSGVVDVLRAMQSL